MGKYLFIWQLWVLNVLMHITYFRLSIYSILFIFFCLCNSKFYWGEDGSGNCLKESQPTSSIFINLSNWLFLLPLKRQVTKNTEDCFSAKELWDGWHGEDLRVPNYLKTVLFSSVCMFWKFPLLGADEWW